MREDAGRQSRSVGEPRRRLDSQKADAVTQATETDRIDRENQTAAPFALLVACLYRRLIFDWMALSVPTEAGRCLHGRSSTRKFPFQQVDVFTAVPFMGNPVAVVLEGDALFTHQMQADRAMDEPVRKPSFVCRPTDAAADYRLRIFTPKNELPFAGHPTIGSAHAVLRHGLEPKTTGRAVQECGKGLVQDRAGWRTPVSRAPSSAFQRGDRTYCPAGRRAEHEGVRLAARRRDRRRPRVADRATAERRDRPLRCSLTWRDCEPSSPRASLASRYSASMVQLRRMAWKSARSPQGRVFRKIPCAAAAMGASRRSFDVTRWSPIGTDLARQGRCLGRDGRVAVRFGQGGAIWVGGHSVTCVEGSISV